MARIEGELLIDRPVDVVFDYVADQSNEPQYNPQMVRAEKITAGPGGEGTRFHSAVASRGRTAEMLIEYTGYDRPRLLQSTSAMAQADISYTLTFEPAGAGTRMAGGMAALELPAPPVGAVAPGRVSGLRDGAPGAGRDQGPRRARGGASWPRLRARS